MDREKLEELKQLNEDGVIDDSTYQRAVDKELGVVTDAPRSTRRNLNGAYKKVLILAAVAVVFAVIFIFWATIGFKPAGISERDYGLGKEAVSVTESYLNGSISASDAYEQLSELEDQMDDLGLRIDTGSITIEIMNEYLDLGEANEGEIRASLSELRKSVGYLF